MAAVSPFSDPGRSPEATALLPRPFPGLLPPGLGGEEAPEGRGRPRERPAAAPPGFEALSAPRGSASGSFLVLFPPFFVPCLTAGGVPPTPCASHGDFAILQRRCFRECGELGGCSVPWGFGCVLGMPLGLWVLGDHSLVTDCLK